MPDEDAPERIYLALVALSREACASGGYATAYYALAAAMHSAADANNAAHLNEVEDIAYEQLDWIDAHAPMDRLSTAASAARGSPNRYLVLANEARAFQQRLVALQ